MALKKSPVYILMCAVFSRAILNKYFIMYATTRFYNGDNLFLSLQKRKEKKKFVPGDAVRKIVNRLRTVMANQSQPLNRVNRG